MVTTDKTLSRDGTAQDGKGKKGKSKQRKQKDRQPEDGKAERAIRRGEVDNAAAMPAPASPAAEGSDGKRGRPTVTKPARVSVGGAALRIRDAAAVSESLDVRRRLRRLARQVERRADHVQQMGFIETAIAECLEEAEAASDRERWLACEAATWALAWMARTRRAGGSAGALLERLVKLAREACGRLAASDTLPARFVLALARLFGDVEACRRLEHDAATAVAEEIARLVSAEGTVGLAGSAAVVERVVRWSAVREVAESTGPLPWDAATETQFAAAVATSLRLLGDDGRLLLGPGRMPPAFSDPLLVAAAAARRGRLRRTATAVQGGGGRRRGTRSSRGRGGLLPRDLHDADAAVAVLRSGWQSGAVRVLVEYRDAVPHLEIAVADRLVVAGPWAWQASLDGRPLEAEGPWKLSCYESDGKASFLEIAAPVADPLQSVEGWQLERQIVLLPQDGIVLLADAITHRPTRAGGDVKPQPPAGALRLGSLLPLAPSLEGKQSADTREILVHDTKPRFTALPLALPEWTAGGRGRFTATEAGLALEHDAAGSRCYCPLWLDFDAARHPRPLTWRQLSVADTRQNLPPQQAVAYRVQAGIDQWLLYRALDEPRNRSVLGCNLSCEFLLGRIGKKGIVKRLLEIE